MHPRRLALLALLALAPLPARAQSIAPAADGTGTLVEYQGKALDCSRVMEAVSLVR